MTCIALRARIFSINLHQRAKNKLLERMSFVKAQNGRIFRHALLIRCGETGTKQSNVKRLYCFFLPITESNYNPFNIESVIAQNGHEQGRNT